jgi:NADPH:quinone reductase-like Zn-dependent oxidoreductase
VFATTVTSADSRIRGFRIPLSYTIFARMALGIRRPRNAILGSELAGVVESVGNGVTRFKPGDRVFAYPGHEGGAYAEYLCMREDACVALKPASVTFEEAAAIPFGGNTALHFLRQGKVRSGQRLLVYGASGNVGAFAVQLAKVFGADVTGVCGPAHVDLVRSLGADRVIDYSKEDFAAGGDVYDVILDAVGKIPFTESMTSLKSGGTLLQVVAAPAFRLRMGLSLHKRGRRVVGGTATPKTENLDYLRELVEAGKIKPVIDRRYTLEQIVDAHQYVDQGHKKGSVVISLT